jgi:hypothetical protein
MYVEPCDRPRGEPAPANSSFLVVSLLWGTLLFGILLIVVRYAEVSKEETARPGVSPLFKQCFSGARGAALCFQRDVSTRRLARGGSNPLPEKFPKTGNKKPGMEDLHAR